MAQWVIKSNPIWVYVGWRLFLKKRRKDANPRYLCGTSTARRIYGTFVLCVVHHAEIFLQDAEISA
jgi:hypothetical protein